MFTLCNEHMQNNCFQRFIIFFTSRSKFIAHLMVQLWWTMESMLLRSEKTYLLYITRSLKTHYMRKKYNLVDIENQVTYIVQCTNTSVPR